MPARPTYIGPPGVARHPHLTTFDTKYNPEGLYHYESIMDPSKETDAFVELVQKGSEAGFDELANAFNDGQGMTPAERKRWKLYCPVRPEEDDQGNPTGKWIAAFKQNRVIHFKDGSTKEVEVGIKDAGGKKDVKQEVWGGSVLRPMFTMRPNKMTSSKEMGVRLDLVAVQVITLRTKGMGGGGPSFDAVDGGYVDAMDQAAFDPSEGPTPLGGDY